jgi:hypothetical protein
MKNDRGKEIVYAINVNDVQEVSGRILERRLTRNEIALVKDSVGNYVDWVQVIENAICRHVHS